jgi:hypothetical protein
VQRHPRLTAFDHVGGRLQAYTMPAMMPGVYKFYAYLQASKPPPVLPVRVQAEVVTDFGRAAERRRRYVLDLHRPHQAVPIADVQHGSSAAGAARSD